MNFKTVLMFGTIAILLCGSAIAADGLVGWWKFDEGKGTMVADSSGNGNDGEIFGVTSWVEGVDGKSLEIVGGGVSIPGNKSLLPPVYTVCAWMNGAETQVPAARLLEKGHDNRESYTFQIGVGNVDFTMLDPERSTHSVRSVKPFEMKKWVHIAGVYDGQNMLIYINGKLENKREIGKVTPYPGVDEPLVIGNRPPDMSRPINAKVDDVRLYGRVLSADEIWQLYAWRGGDPAYAALPTPIDGAGDALPSVKLKWLGGVKAKSHDVYIGQSEQSVANAGKASPEFKGSTAEPSFDPGSLAFGKTYYWRVDGSADGKTWKGKVWNFRVIGGYASNPSPDPMLKNITGDVTLTWKANSLAKAHDLYFGDSLQAVDGANKTSKTFKGTLPKGKESYKPGKLEEGKFYYWRVDEVCDAGVARGKIWEFRTKGGNLVLQVDLSAPTCDQKGLWEGTAKPGWAIWAAPAWADMYMHDHQWFPLGKEGADPAGIDGTGIQLYMTTGSEGQLGIGAKGICRNNLGGGGCPSGKAVGDPIANTWAYGVDWVGPVAGDILLVFKGLPAGMYELYSYHNFWEPCTQKTRNCLDCVCGMPPMPSITANPLPSEGMLRYHLPKGTGEGVMPIENAYDVAPQHVYSDEELVPSVVKFATDGSEVLIIYQADQTEPLYPDCARKGREGARGILNAFELIQVEGM